MSFLVEPAVRVIFLFPFFPPRTESMPQTTGRAPVLMHEKGDEEIKITWLHLRELFSNKRLFLVLTFPSHHRTTFFSLWNGLRFIDIRSEIRAQTF